MTELNWFTSMFSGKTAKGDAVSASAFNVTKIVSIFVTLFAGLTQGLKAAGIAGLSTTQMVTIWLVAAGLVVLLGVTDMVCRAYVTAKKLGSDEASVAKLGLPLVDVRTPGTDGHRDAELLGILADGSEKLAHVHWADGKGDADAWVPLADITGVHKLPAGSSNGDAEPTARTIALLTLR